MKISRLNIREFSIDECPTIERNNIGGENLVVFGGNRSGKTLTFNAILYGLYGRDATFEVSPGLGADVSIHLDNGDVIYRGNEHTYEHDGESLDAHAVTEYLGQEAIVRSQFLHSNINEQPLSVLDGQDLLWKIRTVLNSDLQAVIEKHATAKNFIKHRIEIERRGGGDRPSLDELRRERDAINIDEMQNRLGKIEHLYSLFDSGEIVNIRDRLQRNDEITARLQELTDQRTAVRDTLRQKQRELREAQRYTDQVSDLIIDAIQELPCPVCDRLVPESTAETRLNRGNCPHCGQSRGLSELKADLREQIDEADESIKPLEEEIEALQTELEEIENEIEQLRGEDPELAEVDSLVQTALDNADYDIETARQDTEEWLKEYQETLEEDKERLADIEERIAQREAVIERLQASLRVAEEAFHDVAEECFTDEIVYFQERWTENYQALAPDLASTIEITRDGTVNVPGTRSDGVRSYDKLSSGEQRLLNISFAFTLAQLAGETSDGAHHWEVLVMDEPLTNVEEEIQEHAVSVLVDSDIQCIMTTSNETIRSLFRPRNVKNLDRIALEPTTLDRFA